MSRTLPKRTTVLALVCVMQAGQAAPPAAAVASAHPLATEAGMLTLSRGGNAFDAAITVAAVLGVVEPYSSGIGGGGFWLLHRASDGMDIMVDGRERAPLAAHRTLYLNDQGEPLPDASINGPLAAGIPGMPAALAHLSEHYGNLTLARSLAPAVTLATEGFPVDQVYVRMAEFRRQALGASPAARAIFLDGGEVPQAGTLIRQTDLARVLHLIGNEGRSGFYAGPIAESLVAGVRAAGGIWAMRDLVKYQVREREPVRGQFGDIRFTSAALPSSGGIVLAEMLNILAGYGEKLTRPMPGTHLQVEAMRRAYRDRAVHLGDPDFVEIPVGTLTDPAYAAGLRAGIRIDRATPSDSLPGVAEIPGPNHHTTHYSILDGDGNRVAATLSINYPFGSGFIPPGTGVLLNDEMDDFITRPGHANVYGLTGGRANEIEPGKRMLSSMTPTFLESDSRIAILGTPGGSRIITSVLQATLLFHQGADAEALVSTPRFHHQYYPDEIQAEPGALGDSLRRELEARGHRVRTLDRPYGNMQAIVWDRSADSVTAASDPRGIGTAATRKPAVR